MQPRCGDGAGEAGILGQKPISRDDSLCAGSFGFLYDLVTVEVGSSGVSIKEIGNICFGDVLGR